MNNCSGLVAIGALLILLFNVFCMLPNMPRFCMDNTGAIEKALWLFTNVLDMLCIMCTVFDER